MMHPLGSTSRGIASCNVFLFMYVRRTSFQFIWRHPFYVYKQWHFKKYVSHKDVVPQDGIQKLTRVMNSMDDRQLYQSTGAGKMEHRDNTYGK